MAATNVYSLDNPPEVEFDVNNRGGKDFRCLNHLIRLKTPGLKAKNYLCATKSCKSNDTSCLQEFAMVMLDENEKNC